MSELQLLTLLTEIDPFVHGRCAWCGTVEHSHGCAFEEAKTHVRNAAPLLNAHVAAWLDWLRSTGKAVPTIKLYRKQIIELAQEHDALEALTTEELRRWVDAVATRNNRICAARSFYKFLVGSGVRDDNPAKPIRMTGQRHRRITALAACALDDLDAVLKKLDEHDRHVAESTFNSKRRRVGESRAIATLIVETGLTPSRAIAIRVDCPAPSEITISTGRSFKQMALSEKARDALNFLGGSIPIGARALQRRFEKAAGISPKQLRYTKAKLLVDEGTDAGVAREVLRVHDLKDECARGHEMVEANTYINPLTGFRACRACMPEHRRTTLARMRVTRERDRETLDWLRDQVAVGWRHDAPHSDPRLLYLDRPVTAGAKKSLGEALDIGAVESAEDIVLSAFDAELDNYVADLHEVVECRRVARHLNKEPRYFAAECLGVSLDRVLKMEADIDALSRGVSVRDLNPHGQIESVEHVNFVLEVSR